MVCVHCRMYGVCFIRRATLFVPSKEWNLINNHRARAAIWKESRARYCFFIWYYEIHYVNFYYFGSGGGRKGWKRSRWCVLPVVLYMANLNIAQQYMHARLMIYWERVVHSRITIQICNIQHFSSSIHATRRHHITATGCSFLLKSAWKVLQHQNELKKRRHACIWREMPLSTYAQVN